MADRTRTEHLAWAKQRALAYVDQGDLPNAIASMISDLGKWEGGALYPAALLRLLTVTGAIQKTPGEVRHWIEGFG